ncbi:MAG: UDP-N-acetylmuramoyl-L-alanine--D-glutamate ligase [Eubacteriales bacterium]|nr:UDP-N-acetylmuramoyl-L-alanine--D-glutamate ligase [Eubacteriales bacterium]
MNTPNPNIAKLDLKNKKLLIMGAGKSGQAAASLALQAGGSVLLSDDKELKDIQNIDWLLNNSHVQFCQSSKLSTQLNGVDFAVISPGIPSNATSVLNVQSKNIPIVSELAFGASFMPCPYAAVTGTNGKTTTTMLLGLMFSKGGFVSHVCGNIGFPISTAALSANPADRAVVEVSSFQLEFPDGLHPKAAAILNISADHLDRHGSMEEYISLKKRIYTNMNGDDFLVLNSNDKSLKDAALDAKANVFWFSSEGEVPMGAFLKDSNLYMRDGNTEKLLCHIEDIQMPGLHNLENVLAASSLAYLMGIPVPVIRHSIKTFNGAEHRIEFVKEINGTVYYNDSKATNPDSTIKAIKAMQSPVILIAGGFNKDTPFDALAECIVNSNVKAVVLTGDTANQIAKALKEYNYTNIFTTDSLNAAVLQANKLSKPSDVVLFSPACSSFDHFKSYEERGNHFKDIVNNL